MEKKYDYGKDYYKQARLKHKAKGILPLSNREKLKQLIKTVKHTNESKPENEKLQDNT